jgi:hypothetical protein
MHLVLVLRAGLVVAQILLTGLAQEILGRELQGKVTQVANLLCQMLPTTKVLAAAAQEPLG